MSCSPCWNLAKAWQINTSVLLKSLLGLLIITNNCSCFSGRRLQAEALTAPGADCGVTASYRAADVNATPRKPHSPSSTALTDSLCQENPVSGWSDLACETGPFWWQGWQPQHYCLGKNLRCSGNGKLSGGKSSCSRAMAGQNQENRFQTNVNSLGLSPGLQVQK